MIPAMTTGMMDFMMSSGRITDIAAIPVPDLAVPYAAPRATTNSELISNTKLIGWLQLLNNQHLYFILLQGLELVSTDHDVDWGDGTK